MRTFFYFILFLLPFTSFCQENLDEGQLLLQQKKYTKAAQFYHDKMGQMLVDFKSKNILAQPNKTQLELCFKKSELLYVLEQKGAALAALEETNPALQTFMSADRLINIMRTSYLKLNPNFSWRETTLGLYEKAIDLTYQAKNNKRAFYFFEKSKSVLQVNTLESKKLLSDSLSTKETQLLQAAKVMREAAAKDKTQHPAYIQNNKDLAILQIHLAENYPKYYAKSYDMKMPDLQENGDIYSYEKETEYIHFFCGQKYIYSLHFGAGKSKFNRILRTTKVDNLIKNCSTFDSTHSEYDNLSMQVYDLLLKPLFPDGQFPKKLVILKDDLLKDLSFNKFKNEINIQYAYSIKNLKNEQLNLVTELPSSKQNNLWKLLFLGGVVLLVLGFLFLRKKRKNNASNS